MAPRFATVSKVKILAENEGAAPRNTKKETNLGCWCLLVGRKKFSYWICNKIIKNDPQSTVN